MSVNLCSLLWWSTSVAASGAACGWGGEEGGRREGGRGRGGKEVKRDGYIQISDDGHVNRYLGNTVPQWQHLHIIVRKVLPHWTNIETTLSEWDIAWHSRPHSRPHPLDTPTRKVHTVPGGGLGLKTLFCSSISQPRSSATTTESNHRHFNTPSLYSTSVHTVLSDNFTLLKDELHKAQP